MTVVRIADARADREVREFRNAIRSIGEIARRAVRGEGETRMNALLTIDRISAKTLNENP